MRLYSLCLAACFGLGAIALPIELISPILESRANAQTVEEQRERGNYLTYQGLQQLNAGEFQAATDLFQQALEIYQAINDKQGEGLALMSLGRVYADTGRYPQAIRYYESAQTIFRAIEFHSGEGIVINNIGEVYHNQGQYSEALEQFQQALVIVRKVNYRNSECAILNNIGKAYQNQGRSSEALEQFRQALVIAREINDPLLESTTLSNMGVTYQTQGEYVQALENLQQALAIAQENGYQVHSALTLNSMGELYRSLGQYVTALDHLQQAAAIAQAIGSRFTEAIVYNNMGVVYSDQELYSQALEQSQESLAIRLEIEDYAGAGITLSNIGATYGEMGEYSQALRQHEEALIIARETGRQELESTALSNIGVTYSNLGRDVQALENYQQSLIIDRRIGNRGGEGNTLVQMGIALLRSNHPLAAEETLFEAVEVLDSLRSIELSDTDKVSLFETQAGAYGFLQQALVAQNNSEKTLTALAVSERGRGRAFADLLAFHQAEPAFSIPPNITDIQRIARQQNATLVQYSVIDNVLGVELYIWVVEPSGEVSFRSVDLATLEQPLSELVSTSRESIGVGNRGATVRPVPSAESQQQREAEQRQKLQQLHQLLIEPIQDLLPANAEEPVIFIPHSELFLVPFPALMSSEGRYLIQDHTILTAPSIQVLQFTRQIGQSNGARNRSTSADQVLVVGNPIMPTLWNPDQQTSEPLPSLPGAEEEAIAISTLFNTEPLMWDEASESTVVQRMQSAQVIHLATHGLLEYGNPQESGVRDFPGAIALAPDNTNDGLLTSSEILDLNLNAELVVLSACDTGRGNLTSDGVIGLSRSFISAGVPSIIVSLWAVDDNATSELMQEFYRRWQTNEQPLDKAQALRQAMLTTMQTHPDPRDWAAFTLIGERE